MDEKDIQIAELKARIEKLENDLIHDQLTGLKTRQYLTEQAEAILKKDLKNERRHDRYWVSVLFCDIDDFKQLNDRYGHHVGDEVLKEVAKAIEKCVRQVDVVSRWGGEEIVIWMTGSNDITRPDSFLKAREICDQVMQIKLNSEPSIKVSVSIGVVNAGSDESLDIDTLVKRADKAMYEAKRRGKNQAVVAH